MEGSGPRFARRKNLTCVSFHGKIWVLAGVASNKEHPSVKDCWHSNDVWSSPDGCNWTQVTASAPWSERGLPSVVVYKDEIWLTGGRRGQQGVTFARDIWHSPDGLTWAKEETAPPWPPRYYESLVLDDSIWILGGIGDNNVRMNDVWRFARR
jgi:hypothetical protein